MPPPEPPRVKEGRITVGKPISDCTASASSMLCAMRARAHLKADVGHRLAEQLAVLGHVDGALRGADHLHVEFLEHALAHQVERGVERRLPAHGRQQRAGPFLLDDALDGAPVDGLDVDRVGRLRVGHDGGRIGVHQNDPIAFFFQGLTRLSSGIVELAGLADDDGPRADDEDAVEVGTLRHRSAAFRGFCCLTGVRPREFA